MHRFRPWKLACSVALIATFTAASMLAANLASAQDAKKAPRPEYPPLSKITEGFTEVEVQDGTSPFFRLWKNEKTGQMLAQLPKDFGSSRTRHFIAPTVSGGEIFAGLQSDDFYVYWRQYGKKVALIQENLAIKGSDEESKSSVNRLFTDRVLLNLPILTMTKGSGPVIDPVSYTHLTLPTICSV